MTIEQAHALKRGDLVHSTYRGPCRKEVGPRGGVTKHVTVCKVTSASKRWKRKPDRVEVSLKFGMYEHGKITNEDLAMFHLPSECPIH